VPASPSGGNAHRLLAPLCREIQMYSMKRLIFGGQFRRDTLTFWGLQFAFFFLTKRAHKQKTFTRNLCSVWPTV
jgi:hypothetical protein